MKGLESSGGSTSWEMMPIPAESMLPKRISPAIASYNDNEIIIIKGDGGWISESKVSLYDTTKTTDCWRTILNDDPILFANNHGF